MASYIAVYGYSANRTFNEGDSLVIDEDTSTVVAVTGTIAMAQTIATALSGGA